MNTKALPSLMVSTAKAEGYFVGALKNVYTKHFAQPQSTDLVGGVWEACVPYAELLLSNYVALGSRHMRSGGRHVTFVCLKQDIFKQKSAADRITALGKLMVLRPGTHQASYREMRFRAHGATEPEAGSLISAFAPLDLKWLFTAMKGGTERSSSEQLMSAISGLNALLKSRSFNELNLIVGMVHPQRLSPELMLTFARVTFPVRDLLTNWYPFVRKVKNELDRRELDSKTLLKGLI